MTGHFENAENFRRFFIFGVGFVAGGIAGFEFFQEMLPFILNLSVRDGQGFFSFGADADDFRAVEFVAAAVGFVANEVEILFQ